MGLERRVRLCGYVVFWAALLSFFAVPSAPGQIGGSTGGTGASATGSSQEVTGRVLNGRTREPVARALVRMGGRVVLTDHDGVFSFSQVAYTFAALSVSKPGFYPASDGNESEATTIQIPVSSQVELLLYPEAIISGTISNAYAEGVPYQQVMVTRSTFDALGHHWTPSGQTQTLSDGSFRLTLAPGDYRLQTRSFVGRRTGQEFILPIEYPTESSSAGRGLHLDPGQEVHLELRAEVRKAYEVTMDTELPPGRGFPVLTAKTVGGHSFPVMPLPGRGEVRFSLPSGSYLLTGRMESSDDAQVAHARITVPDHDVVAPSMEFSPVPIFPVELHVEQAATSDNRVTAVPTAQQLGLIFVPQDDAGDDMRMYAPTSRHGQGLAFELTDGVYRLRSQMAGPWVVTAATCGGIDLLVQDLTVAAGATGVPIRVTVTNQSGSLSGSLTVDGKAGPAWIYMVATTPSISPLFVMRAGSTGTFTRMNVAPGTYRVVALEHKVSADFLDPEVLGRYLDRVQTVTVAAGDKTQVTLEAVPTRDLRP